MAKISDLVKTYRLINDPNAPEWNVKFVGAVVVALAIVAGATGMLLWGGGDAPGAAPAASVQQPPAGSDGACGGIASPSPGPAQIPAECAPTPPAGVLP